MTGEVKSFIFFTVYNKKIKMGGPGLFKQSEQQCADKNRYSWLAGFPLGHHSDTSSHYTEFEEQAN